MTHREVLFDDTTPGTARIAKTPEGAIVVSDPKAVAQWWLREINGFTELGRRRDRRPLRTPYGVSFVVCLTNDGVAPTDPNDPEYPGVGIWWDDERGSTHIRTWREVHDDLGAAIRRAEQ